MLSPISRAGASLTSTSFASPCRVSLPAIPRMKRFWSRLVTQVSTSASICHASTLIASSRSQLDLGGQAQRTVGVATDGFQEFYERWRGGSASPKLADKFPYILELGVNQEGGALLPFHTGDTLGNQILVTESYNNIFHRLLGLRRWDNGKSRGAVLTGQPGTGVSFDRGPRSVQRLTCAPVLQEKPPS